MLRRKFLAFVGGAAVAWSLAARSQQRAIPVIGYLGAQSPELWASRVRAFHQGLNETGYNIARDVTLIVVAGSTPGIVAAKAATRSRHGPNLGVLGDGD